MVRDNALRVAGGAAGVADRNRVPFVGRSVEPRQRRVSGEQRFIFMRPTRSPGPVNSLSQTSMTIGSRPCSDSSKRSASFITGANSLSVISTSASQWFICQASSGASRRVFSVFNTAFTAGTA